MLLESHTSWMSLRSLSILVGMYGGCKIWPQILWYSLLQEVGPDSLPWMSNEWSVAEMMVWLEPKRHPQGFPPALPLGSLAPEEGSCHMVRMLRQHRREAVWWEGGASCQQPGEWTILEVNPPAPVKTSYSAASKRPWTRTTKIALPKLLTHKRKIINVYCCKLVWVNSFCTNIQLIQMVTKSMTHSGWDFCLKVMYLWEDEKAEEGVTISYKVFCLGDRDNSHHLSLGLARLPLTWGCCGPLEAILRERSWPAHGNRRTHCLLSP